MSDGKAIQKRLAEQLDALESTNVKLCSHRAAHFRVCHRLDGAAHATPGTVTVEHGMFVVRPLRRRRTYVLPLDHVATLVCQIVIRSEVQQAKRERSANKRSRRPLKKGN